MSEFSQDFAFYLSLVVYLVIFLGWQNVDPPYEVPEALGGDPNASNVTKGRSRSMGARIKRYIRQSHSVFGNVSGCVMDILRRLLFACLAGFVVLIVTATALQPFLDWSIQPIWVTAVATSKMLGMGLLDALSFDLFSVLGVDLQPKFEQLQARIIIFIFYALEGLIIAETAVKVVANVWTAAVSVLLPEPAIKIARTGRATSVLQHAIKATTML